MEELRTVLHPQLKSQQSAYLRRGLVAKKKHRNTSQIPSLLLASSSIIYPYTFRKHHPPDIVYRTDPNDQDCGPIPNDTSLTTTQDIATITMPPERRLPERQFNPGTLLGCFAASFGLWIITGALAYSHRNTKLIHYDGLDWMVILFTLVINLVMVGVAAEEYGLHPNPPRSRAAVQITAFMFFSTTTAFCIAIPAEGVRNLFLDLFLVTGSALAGSGFEMYTGLLTGYVRSFEGDGIRIQ